MLPEMLNNAKIFIKKTKQPNQAKAIVTIDFNDFKIKWFRIKSDDQGNLWVNPPSIFAGGRFRPMFFIENIETWREFQAKIIEEYNQLDFKGIPVIEDQQ